MVLGMLLRVPPGGNGPTQRSQALADLSAVVGYFREAVARRKAGA